MERPASRSAFSCRRAVLAGALLSFVHLACGAGSAPPRTLAAPPPPPAPVEVPEVVESEPATVEAAPIPGFEDGFLHCCGTDQYAMQIDCRDHLLRCYESKDGEWSQTYGRHCRSYLEPSCYQEGCLDVCE